MPVIRVDMSDPDLLRAVLARQLYFHDYRVNGEVAYRYGWVVDEAAAKVAGRVPDCSWATALLQLQVQRKIRYIDHGYAMRLSMQDLTRPAVMATLLSPVDGSSIDVLVDGAHRVYRAYYEGWDTYPAVRLTPIEDESCRIPDRVLRVLAAIEAAGLTDSQVAARLIPGAVCA